MLFDIRRCLFPFLFVLMLLAGGCGGNGVLPNESELPNLGITFTKQFGGDGDNSAVEIHETSDGNYITAGYKQEPDSENTDIWVAKIDKNGRTLWEKVFDKSDDEGISVIETGNHDYIVAGFTDYPENPMHGDIWIIRLDSSGTVVWQKTISRAMTQPHKLAAANDNGFVLTGFYIVDGNAIPYEYNPFVMKFDSSGNIDWEKSYDGDNMSFPSSIIQTMDGGYISVGISDIMKISGDGTFEWSKTIEGQFYSVTQDTEGDYLIAGSTYWGTIYNAKVVKLKNNGETVWQKEYGIGSTSIFFDIKTTSDGGYVAAGRTGTGINQGMVILKLNKSGDESWVRQYGTGNYAVARSIEKTSDSGYIIAGSQINPSKTDSYYIQVWKLGTTGLCINCY